MYPITSLDNMIASEWNLQPSSVRGVANQSTAYYQRQLFKLVYGHYEFTLPMKSDGQAAWKYNWFRFLLFGYGSLGVFYTKKYGWIPLPYTVLRVDEQFNPFFIQSVSNQYLPNTVRGVVGITCEIIQISDDFFGMYDIVTHYATKLAEIDKGINVNLMNCSIGLYMEASDTNEARDIKTAYEEATTGKPLVTVVKRKKDMEDKQYKTMLANPKSAYLVGDFLNDRRTVINQFLTEIGIRNANTNKRERLISDEVLANGEEVEIARDYVYDNIKRGMLAVRKMTGLDLDIRKKNII